MTMTARVESVKAARKPQGKCEKCGVEIGVGDAYRHFSPGFRGRKRIRCMKASCTPRMSERTSGNISEVYALQESFEDAEAAGFESTDDLRSAFEEYAEGLRSYAEDRRSGADQWEHGNEMLEEAAYAAEEAADNAEGHEIEDFDDSEPERTEYDEGDDGDEEFEADHADWEERRDGHLQEQIDAASEIVQQGIEG